MKSTRWTLQARDWLKGALVAFGTTALTTLTQSLNSGTMPTVAQLKIAGIAGVSALLVYIVKNLATDDVKVAEKVIIKAKEQQVKDIQKETDKLSANL